MAVGLLLLAGGFAAFFSGDAVARDCFAYIFCDTYAGSEDGAALSFGLTGIAVGTVSLLWGIAVWFIAPVVLREEPRDPNQPPGP